MIVIYRLLKDFAIGKTLQFLSAIMKTVYVAVEKILTLPATTTDVGELLSSAHAKEKALNRHCLLTL